jgi:hypothetical protein
MRQMLSPRPSGWGFLMGDGVTDKVSTSFKLSPAMDKALPLLAEIHRLEGKSEYIRHLIQTDMEEQLKLAGLYTQLIRHIDGNSQYDEALPKEKG